MALPRAWANLTAVATTRHRPGLRRLMMVSFLAGLAAVLFHGSIASAAQYFHAVPYVKTGSASFSGQCGNVTRGNEGLAIFGVPKELQTPDAIDGSLTSVKARIDSVIDPNNRIFVGQERTLSYAVEVGVEAVGQGPGGSNRNDTIGIYPTVNSVGLDGSCTFLYSWAFKQAGPLSWKVSLTSQEVSNNAPPNNGQIKLNGKTYNLASLSDPLPTGTYDVQYLPGGPFDSFDHWGAFDGIQVNSVTANPARVTVSGVGNLVAYYRRSTSAASLSITVLRPGGLSGTNLNALVLYKGGVPIQNADPTGTSFTWTNLDPATYNVESYINDMFAGETGGFSLSAGQNLSKTINASAAASLTVTVYYSNATTPLSGANVDVYSHELDKNPGKAQKWASGTTNSNGQVSFTLQPSTLALEYYIIKVVNDGTTVKNVKLSSGSSRGVTTSIAAPIVTARIDSLNGTTTTVQKGQNAIVQYAFTNTGDTSWTFGAGAFLRRPDGSILDLPLRAKSLAPGGSATVNWTYTTDKEGNWDLRVSVWKEPSIPLSNRLADTDWLSRYVSVTAVEANQKPVIRRIRFDPDIQATGLIVGSKVRISVAADDPEGDPLIYTWTFSRGASVDGNTHSATLLYQVPDDTGILSFTIWVGDGKNDATHTIWVDAVKPDVGFGIKSTTLDFVSLPDEIQTTLSAKRARTNFGAVRLDVDWWATGAFWIGLLARDIISLGSDVSTLYDIWKRGTITDPVVAETELKKAIRNTVIEGTISRTAGEVVATGYSAGQSSILATFAPTPAGILTAEFKIGEFLIAWAYPGLEQDLSMGWDILKKPPGGPFAPLSLITVKVSDVTSIQDSGPSVISVFEDGWRFYYLDQKTNRWVLWRNSAQKIEFVQKLDPMSTPTPTSEPPVSSLRPPLPEVFELLDLYFKGRSSPSLRRVPTVKDIFEIMDRYFK